MLALPLVLALLFDTVHPLGESLPTLALAAVEARAGATAADGATVGDALTAQLVEDGRLRVVERQQLAKVMKEQALAQTGAMSDEVQVRLAQLVGARFVAVGAVQGDGPGFVVSLRAVDSSSGQVTWAQTLKAGARDQLDGAARLLARRLEDKLAGGTAGTAGAGALASDAVGDFDAAQVKDAGRALARALSARFPKITGKVVDSLPDGTATCAFGAAQPFAGEFFEVTGRDEVTETDQRKGYFLLRSASAAGCAGKLKREGGADIGAGDALGSLPLKIALAPLEAGAGTPAILAKLLTDEARTALSTVPQLVPSDSPQLTVRGSVSGPRGRRTVSLQVVDRSGAAVDKLELPGAF